MWKGPCCWEEAPAPEIPVDLSHLWWIQGVSGPDKLVGPSPPSPTSSTTHWWRSVVPCRRGQGNCPGKPGRSQSCGEGCGHTFWLSGCFGVRSRPWRGWVLLPFFSPLLVPSPALRLLIGPLPLTICTYITSHCPAFAHRTHQQLAS